MPEDIGALADALVRSYVGYQGGSFVVVADNASFDIGTAIMEAVDRVTAERIEIGQPEIAGKVALYDLDSYRQGTPLVQMPESLRESLQQDLSGPDENHNTLLYIFEMLPEEGAFRRELSNLAAEQGRIGGLPSCTFDVLTAGFHPENNPAFIEELYEALQQETEVQITCDRGSDLLVEFDHDRYDVVNSNGVLVPGRYANPLPGEVFAYPANVEGTLVITGSYGPLVGHERFRGNLPALVDAFDKNPMTWSVERGRVTDVVCGDREMQEFVRREVFELDPEHGPRVGEVGFPANLYVLKRALTGNFMIDEKGRMHVAHGHGYAVRTGCPYDTTVHGDGLLANASVKSLRLGRFIMTNNDYNEDIFASLR